MCMYLHVCGARERVREREREKSGPESFTTNVMHPPNTVEILAKH